jgi:hypothetical protein
MVHKVTWYRELVDTGEKIQLQFVFATHSKSPFFNFTIFGPKFAGTSFLLRRTVPQQIYFSAVQISKQLRRRKIIIHENLCPTYFTLLISFSTVPRVGETFSAESPRCLPSQAATSCKRSPYSHKTYTTWLQIFSLLQHVLTKPQPSCELHNYIINCQIFCRVTQCGIFIT